MTIETEHQQHILTSLDQYDSCRLECDGLTRVLSYVLNKAAIGHHVMLGEIADPQTHRQFSPHFWIVLPDGRHIDYRARMWLGQAEHIPHGVFDAEDYPITYTGEAIQFENVEQIAVLLLQLECGDQEWSQPGLYDPHK